MEGVCRQDVEICALDLVSGVIGMPWMEIRGGRDAVAMMACAGGFAVVKKNLTAWPIPAVMSSECEKRRNG